MHPVLFEVFGRPVTSYGACMVLGAVAAWIVIRLLAGRDRGEMFYAFLMCICGGLLGAILLRPLTRIPEIFINWDFFRGAGAGVILDYLFGEIVFYGGLIGGAAGLILYCRNFKISPLPIADVFAPGLALAHAVGRVGCFLGGCCYGAEVSEGHPFAVRYPAGVTGPGGGPGALGHPVLAVQLIEAAGLLAISAALTVLFLRVHKGGKEGSRVPGMMKAPGMVVCAYGFMYSVMRFVLEFYRGDKIRGVYGALSTSQYISIALFAVSLAIFFTQFRKRRIDKAQV